MLTRIHGKFQVECDACGETLETDTRDFNEAIRTLNNESWKARKLGRDWVHSCPGCAEEGPRNERARRGGRIP